MTASFDAIVIGAGANGLVAAHYLARAGKRVVVVEQRQAADPSADVGWVPPRVIRDLGLSQLRLEQPNPWLTVPLDGGNTLELSRDMGRSVEAIRRISPADAAKWPEFSQRMRTLAGVLEKLYLAPPPDIETRDPRELARIGGLGLYVRRLGKQAVIDLARILPMAIAELLDDWFESDALKGAIGALGIWHLKQGPRSGGTAFNFLHHHVGSPAGVFRPVRSNVTQALEGMKRVEVRRGNRATVLAKNGRAIGVVLEQSGETILAPLVVSSAPPRGTLDSVAIELDPEFVRAVRNIKERGVVARGTLTLDRAPPPSYANFCIAPSLDYLERAYDDAKYGRDSAAPYVEVQRFDGNRLELHVQYVPPGTHEGLAERVAQVLKARPDQLQLQAAEQNLYHGELTLDQILFMRPVPGWSRYRTPIAGLFLCGSGTHPGGGIPGAAGRNAAREIL
ncbi:MAG TPA: NAD(P)/FAD-dependent oxidoreductase [Gemmatimonadales bacterium]|nr:NAD(P)/FAD-dependent oxidoreductase [Gemmatimonadales bacterium]